MNADLGSSIRVLLVQPVFSKHNLLNFKAAARLVGAYYTCPPLGLLTVAALLPQHWQIRVVDENVRDLTEDDIAWADIVMTGGMLPQQNGILRTLQRAQAHSKPVVVGGIDPTCQPEVYSEADYLVIGEGEVSVPLFVEDFVRGSTTGIYQADRRADLGKEAVTPRFDLVDFQNYLRVDVQFSRGCPYHCEYCAVVELFGRKPRSKTSQQILAELTTLYDLGYRGHINLLDDNFYGSKLHAVKMLKALKPWSEQHGHPFFFSTDASINLSKDAAFLELMRANDFRYVFLGIETPDEEALRLANKHHNLNIPIVEAVRTFNRYGMMVIGGLIVGFDGETDGTSRALIDVVQEAGICLAYPGLLMALPHTRLFERLTEEGRLYGGLPFLMRDVRGDHTTNGLNFVPERPRARVIADYRNILAELFDEANFYQRVQTTVTHLSPNYLHRPGWQRTFGLLRVFVRVSAKATMMPGVGGLYWRTLIQAFWRNPHLVSVVVNMTALYVHFAQQADSIQDILAGQIEEIQSLGEAQYHVMRVGVH